MQTVKVSPKYQIVIPKEVREKLKLRPGQKLLIYERDGSIRIEPPRPISELRGMARGMKWKDDYRDHTERF
jgi:AbrB family looped-hinge helix DNA binding protein